ncbi:MAG: hypothetical protein AAF222_05360 [Pseudomonadota bacterium]
MRTAFVHIGMPKTGTTAIQAACARARQALSDHGYHYLSGDRNHGERLSLAFWDKPDALHLAGLRWHDGDAAHQHRADIQAALAYEVDTTTHHVIFSAEDLSDFRPSEVERLHLFLGKRFDRIRIIGSLREPLSWATSAAQQATKWSGDLLDDLFDAPRMPEFERRFAPWIATFGANCISLCAYGEEDSVDAFSAALGLKAALPPAPRLNEGVSDQTAILYAHANRLAPPFVDTRHNPFRSFDLTRVARLPGRAFTLPRETVEAAQDTLRAEREWANAALGKIAFRAPALPGLARDMWFGDDRAALENLAAELTEKTRQAQNERALKMAVKAQRNRSKPEVAGALLDQAWLLATDRWTMDLVATEAVQQDVGDRQKYFAKGRLMRRIEAPAPGDPALLFGNPFDRPWRRRRDAQADAA